MHNKLAIFGEEQLILASASPRRRELLAQVGVEPLLRPTCTEERLFQPGDDPAALVEENAARKALAAQHPGEDGLILGGDTLVFRQGKAYGKPASPAEARQMLGELSGREHWVYTGLCLLEQASGRLLTGHTCTLVEFLPLSQALIDAYVADGEPLDKAGAYGIQGKGALLIKRIDGDYGGVVGLSLPLLQQLYQKLQSTQQK